MVRGESDSSSDVPHLSDLQASRLAQVLLSDVDDEVGGDLPRLEGYLLERRLGEGGGGEVFLGVRTGSDRPVAVKFMRRRIEREIDARRAWRELELLERVRLPGLPHVYDHGIRDGHMFIVFEYIDGTRLDEYCKREELDRDAIVRLLIATARLVHRLNERGVIHRDIKPSNVLVTEAGEPVLIDLGVAALLSDDPEDSLGGAGAPIGSPAFMSPEQARGEGAAITARSDVYSLTATACLLLTGSTPHDVKVPLHEAIRRVAQDPPRDPATLDTTLPKPLAHFLRRALSTNPKDRHSSAAEFGDDLQRFLDGEPIEWQRPGWWARQQMAWRRDPRRSIMKAAIWVLSLVSIGALAAATGLGTVAQERDALLQEQEEILQETSQMVAEQDTLIAEKQQQLLEYSESLEGLKVQTTILADAILGIEDEANAWFVEGGEYAEMIGAIRVLEPIVLGAELPPMTEVLIGLLHAVYQTEQSNLGPDVELLREPLDQLEQARREWGGPQGLIDINEAMRGVETITQDK